MIESLNNAQLSTMSDYVSKWTQIGYNTDPIDKIKATAAINNLYKCGKLEAPKTIVFCSGPLNAMLTLYMYMYKKDNPDATKKMVINYAKKNVAITTCGFGQHDVGWVSFYDFFKEQCDFKGLEILSGTYDVCNECGWYWAYNDICFVAEKPITLSVNDMNILHCEDGPACAYNDGTKIFAYEGVIVTEDIIMHPESITVASINSCDNEEVKRVMVIIYGVNRYIEDLGAKTIDIDMVTIDNTKSDSDAIPRALIRDKNGNQYFVGTDGSTERTYFMNVSREVNSCAEAHNSISPIDETNIIASS